ncbi:MAG: SGNH/GDSL hydrolase family protein [Clostridia bacterium]|nr:SGNH/GDSL hydrolase family protein [Clostridia bacterium]
MKEYLNKYTSNTLASSSNQLYFNSNNEIQRSRAFYKIFAGGKYEYSFLFSNIIDSTYADGSISVANESCDEWEMKAKILLIDSKETNLSSPKIENEYNLTFNKNSIKTVISKEIFYSDPIVIEAKKNDYFCVEIEFKGTKIPYFEEILIPTFRQYNGKWIPDKKAPVPAMLGAKREVEKKIGFLGDSITEGIGTPMNKYTHWNAIIAEKIGEKYSYWNLGIGYGRANDVAFDGIWLEKAKNLDLVTICFGVNDLGRGYTASEIENNLLKVVKILQKNNVKTILFTIPPFDYNEETKKKWNEINNYILTELSKITEVYDVAKIWGQDFPNNHLAKYGGHPDENGCMIMAKDFLNKYNL